MFLRFSIGKKIFKNVRGSRVRLRTMLKARDMLSGTLSKRHSGAVLSEVYEEVESILLFTHLGPDQREDTKWDENKIDSTTSNGANGAVARKCPREHVEYGPRHR